MSSSFIRPRFIGERFDKHSLPLDVARDLAAYQNLIIEVAKRLYFKDHPERQRTPRGFNSAFELHLERVEEGSAILPLIAFTTAINAEPQALQYFDQARDLVSECIAAPPDQLPEDFPLDLLSYFNQIGSSLHEGEQMELPRGAQNPATLTPAKRKSLVLAQSEVYERPVELVGHIAEIDWEKKTFRLRSVDGSQATVPLPESFEQKARAAAGTPRNLVTIKGIASFDAAERLRSVDHVEAITLQLNHELMVKLEAISSLQDGWYNGAGKAPETRSLADIIRSLVPNYPSHLKLPAIVPTQDGNILLEWSSAGDPSLDIDLATMQSSFHRFANDGGDIEKEFTLRSEEDWRKLMSFLSQHIERNA